MILKNKAKHSYIACLTGKPNSRTLQSSEVAVDRQEPIVLLTINN